MLYNLIDDNLHLDIYEKLINTCIIYQPTEVFMINKKQRTVSTHTLCGHIVQFLMIAVIKMLDVWLYGSFCAVSVSQMTLCWNVPGAQEHRNYELVENNSK